MAPHPEREHERHHADQHMPGRVRRGSGQAKDGLVILTLREIGLHCMGGQRRMARPDGFRINGDQTRVGADEVMGQGNVED